MTEATNTPRRVTTVDTMFDLLEYVRDQNGASVVEIADDLDLARSTVHDHLVTLRERGFVVNENGTYHMGLKFLDLGQYAKSRYKIAEVAQPTIEKLADQSGEHVALGIEDQGEFVKLAVQAGDQAVSVHDWIGERRPIHAYSVGKGILAHLPEDRIDEIVDQHGLTKYTENTITDRDALFEELERIREEGVAFNDQEYKHGVRAVSAPIVYEGEVLGGLTISGPASRFSGEYFEEELPKHLRTAANEVELKWSIHKDRE